MPGKCRASERESADSPVGLRSRAVVVAAADRSAGRRWPAGDTVADNLPADWRTPVADIADNRSARCSTSVADIADNCTPDIDTVAPAADRTSDRGKAATPPAG